MHLAVGDGIRTLKAADSEVHTNKGRNVLKVLSPIPLISGKATLEIKGEHSQTKVTSDRPEFYISLSAEERFGIIRIRPGKAVRILDRDEGEADLNWNVAVGMVRPDDNLREAIDGALERLRADGTIDRIYKRYGVLLQTPK